MPVQSDESALPRPARNRPVVSWVALIIGGLLTALWVLSRYYILWIWSDHGQWTTGYGIGYGMFGARTFVFPPSGDWKCLAFDRLPDPHWRLWQWGAQPTGFTDAAVSFWPLALAFFAVGMLIGRSAARARSAPVRLRAGSRRIAIGIAASIAGVLTVAACALSLWWPPHVQWKSWDIHWSAGLVRVTQTPGVAQSLRWRRSEGPDSSFVWRVPDELPVDLSRASMPARVFPSTAVKSSGVPTVAPDWSVGVAHGANVAGTKMCDFVGWPIPALLLVCGLSTLWFGMRVRRRRRMGACPVCGYSLSGLGVDAPCPECGKARPLVR